jgi:purine-binding chemotaxis protein CheW
MSTAQTPTPTSESLVPESQIAAGQFLTFLLAGEEYGVDILKVHEIRGWTPVTHIPRTPPYVQGVLNLRGAIVPIIDLRRRFDIVKADYTPTTVVIVLAVEDARGKRVIGMVVDGVSGVINVAPGETKPSPDFGCAVHTEFIRGMAAIGKRMVILLDSDKLLTEEEMGALDAVQQQAAKND